MYARPRRSRPRRFGSLAMAVGVVALAAGSLYATVSVVGTAFGQGPLGSAGSSQPAVGSPPLGSGSIAVGASGGIAQSSGSPSIRPSVAPSGGPKPSPTPKPGPFRMDLYRSGAFVSELTPIWCLSAAMQTSANIMDLRAGKKADVTRTRQKMLFTLSRSIAPAPDKAAEPEGWAAGLTRLGYGKYTVSVQPSIKAAIQVAAKALRTTGRPVGLMVWRGAHSWVMSGFTATADPALTSNYTVTAVYIEDVWFPRISNIWGASRPPDSLVPVRKLPPDFLPWKRPQKHYAAKDGKFVIVIPVR
ncbi:MAG TPA: hypothetical protein VF323_04040 [Candidatus Limnocylindrales bacterium]